MTENNSRQMLYTPLPTEEDGFKKPVPTLTPTDDEPKTTTTPPSSRTTAEASSRWGGTAADD
ncbi:hypothetical protein [Haloarchaeobius sp. HME9146]|uniref:hypothetical protein n=1 Tax=Haloarchaeobius sp. HME9146 TaxID=2978732 RepID=UPI0021C0ABC2|nr:hypothetical protein [Haloarchaeobius sp. HME9146]MCT9095388.1 hypothetical protein [Haloarchaeobius sp. HME9146]